jgi:hypothetical protein
MKVNLHRRRHGVTLLELTIVILLGIATSAMLMGLFSQQMTFLRILSSQNFLVDDAPLLNDHISKIISKADGYKLYDTQANAVDSLAKASLILPIAGPAPTLGVRASPAGALASAVALRYRLPNGVPRNAVLFFGVPPIGGANGVYFQSDSTLPNFVLLSSKPTAVDFSIVSGVLEIQLTGPLAEQITYAGTRL